MAGRRFPRPIHYRAPAVQRRKGDPDQNEKDPQGRYLRVLLHELETLKKRRKEEYLGRGKNEIPEWVFLSPGQIIWEGGKPVGHAERQPMIMRNFRKRVFLKACDKANIRRRRLHDTRHTFASILLMNGESPAYVKDQLGHSSIKMTVDIYGHWIPGSNRQAVNKLPSLTTPKAHAQVAGD